jgi:hypothetical protein
MIWTSIVSGLLDKVAPEVAKHYREKQQQKHDRQTQIASQKHEIEMEVLRGKQAWEEAKSRRAEASEGRDHEWEMQSLAIHSKGWKDEFVLAVVSIPAIGSFIPGYQPYIQNGFESLGVTPLWYQILLSSIFFAVYGIRIYRREAFTKNVLLQGSGKGN